MAKKRVFLSHSSPDKPFVDRLASDLERMNADVWYDKWEIHIGESLIDRISEGLGASDFLVIVLTPNSVKSDWVRRELNAALIRELEEKRVVVLPVKLGVCTIPMLIREKKYANFTKSYEEGFSELLLAVFPESPATALKSRDFRITQYLVTGLAATDYCGTNAFNSTQLARVYLFRDALRSYSGPEENRLLFWSAVAYRKANPETPPFLGTTVPVWGLVDHCSDEERASWLIEGLRGPLVEHVLPFYGWATSIHPDPNCNTLKRTLFEWHGSGDGVQQLPPLSDSSLTFLYRWFAQHDPNFYEEYFFPNLAANPDKLPMVLGGCAYLPNPPEDEFFFRNSDGSAAATVNAVVALANLKKDAAVDLLKNRCEASKVCLDMASLDQVFTHLGTPVFVQKLQEWLDEHPPIEIWVRIVAALVNAGTVSQEAIVEVFKATADSQNTPELLPMSIRLLGHADSQFAHLIDQYLRPERPICCEAAIFALARMCGIGAAERMKKVLDCSSEPVAAAAIESLARIAKADALKWTARFSRHDNPVMRLAFFRSLQRIQPVDTDDFEEAGFHDDARLVRLVAARSFGLSAQKERLNRWLNDSSFDPIVRTTADERLFARRPFVPRWIADPWGFDETSARLGTGLTNLDPDVVPFAINFDMDRMVHELVMRHSQ